MLKRLVQTSAQFMWDSCSCFRTALLSGGKEEDPSQFFSVPLERVQQRTVKLVYEYDYSTSYVTSVKASKFAS